MTFVVRAFALVLLLSVSAPSIAQVPGDYYAAVDSSSALAFRQSLHDIIDDHQRIPYASDSLDTWYVLEQADQDPNNRDNILDLYGNASYPKYGGRNPFYNQEHCWPTSYGYPKRRVGNYPLTDCHAMFMCDLRYNTSRGNKPYAECGEDCDEKRTSRNNCAGASQYVYPGHSNWTQGIAGGAWETWLGRRGDVARALFYMDVRYEGGSRSIKGDPEPDLILTDDLALITADTENNRKIAYMGMLSVLLRWHREDPVDELERRRNNVIARFQGNRNPFIDHPEWVDCVFNSQCSGDAPTPP